VNTSRTPPFAQARGACFCSVVRDKRRSMNSRLRNFSRLLIAALAAFALPCASFAALQDGPKPNLLKNGDFAQGTDGWDFNAHLKQGKATADPVEKHDGKPSVRIDNLGADDSHLSQKVAVKPATRYRLTGWSKTKNVVAVENPKSTAGASLGVRGGFLKSDSLNKTQSWKRLTVEIVTVAETEIAVGPRLGTFGGTVKGTAWFTDLEFKELGPARR
jgi:hypothetical protein